MVLARRLDHVGAEEQERQRRGEEDEPRDAVEEVQHRVQVAQALAELRPRPESGLSMRKICVMPRAQRMRWPTWPDRLSVARPAACGIAR